MQKKKIFKYYLSVCSPFIELVKHLDISVGVTRPCALVFEN